MVKVWWWHQQRKTKPQNVKHCYDIELVVNQSPGKTPDLHEQKQETKKPQNKIHGWQSLAQGSCVCRRNPSNSTGSLLGADRRIGKDYAENAEGFKQTFSQYLERRMICFHCWKMMKYFPVYQELRGMWGSLSNESSTAGRAARALLVLNGTSSRSGNAQLIKICSSRREAAGINEPWEEGAALGHSKGGFVPACLSLARARGAWSHMESGNHRWGRQGGTTGLTCPSRVTPEHTAQHWAQKVLEYLQWGSSSPDKLEPPSFWWLWATGMSPGTHSDQSFLLHDKTLNS